MANPEHIKILKQRVEVWNKWRKKNYQIQPDLVGADLRGIDLSGAILVRTVLTSAKLTGTKLVGANLGNANLNGANLSDADLSGAILDSAGLIGASLVRANLRNADFRTARLINAKLDGAFLTDACLWEIQCPGWSIKGVVCESVYWDKAAKVKTTYNPGDFERLFAEKTKVRLFFKDGISPIEISTLPALVKHLEDKHPGSGLRLVNIHEESGGAVVELAIEDDSQRSPGQIKQLQAALEAEARRAIEVERRFFAEEKQKLFLEGRLEELRFWYREQLLLAGPQLHIQGGFQMSQDTYNNSGQAGAIGPNAHAHDMTFNQLVNHVEQNIDFDELAKQLGELRQAIMQKQDASPEAAIAIGEVARAELAAGERNTSKVVEHLKTAGKWTLDFAKDIGKDLVAEVIKTATGMS